MFEKKILWPLVLSLILWSCGEKKAEKEKQVIEAEIIPSVFVSNYPLEYFVQRIAGDKVETISFYKEVEEPTTWEPGEVEINALQEADLVLLNGASFEPWAMMLSLPQSKLVITTAAVEDQLLEEKQTVSHSHGPEGAHFTLIISVFCFDSSQIWMGLVKTRVIINLQECPGLTC